MIWIESLQTILHVLVLAIAISAAIIISHLVVLGIFHVVAAVTCTLWKGHR